MNKLEEFVENNREDIDDATPSAEVWQHVEAALNSKKKNIVILTPVVKWSVAAAILLMVGVGAYFIVKKDKVVDPPTAEIRNEILVPDAPGINSVAQLVAMKQEELKTLSKDQPELYEKFATDITQLDSSYKALKGQLNVSPNREMLIEAMVQNLQLQLNVLNQQLNIIHQIKQSKNYSHEKIDQHI